MRVLSQRHIMIHSLFARSKFLLFFHRMGQVTEFQRIPKKFYSQNSLYNDIICSDLLYEKLLENVQRTTAMRKVLACSFQNWLLEEYRYQHQLVGVISICNVQNILNSDRKFSSSFREEIIRTFLTCKVKCNV